METMDRYRIQESIRDVIAILDSAPIRWDMMPDANIVQIANRTPLAHLAIERGLKALIGDRGGTPTRIHALDRLYCDLMECDDESAKYLADAFDDAVRFFRYNVNRTGFRQFQSLDRYLKKVGTEDAFEKLRYWAIGESSGEQSPIPYISLSIHRELLCALWCLFLSRRRDTVSARVERELSGAMFNRRKMVYIPDGTERELSVKGYIGWLHGHTSLRSAFEEAVCKDFAVTDDEFATQTLREAYKELQQSEDPAVRYYVTTLSYLPKGSERRNPDAIPEVRWGGQEQVRGIVATPAGTLLGFIDRYADGAWGITPMQEGPVQIGAIAWVQADAKHYLVNRLTKQVSITVNAESRELRIVGEWNLFPGARLSLEGDTAGLSNFSQTYELEFWNSQHGLRLGDEVKVEAPWKQYDRAVLILEGVVTSVSEQMVSITGADSLDVKRAR